MTNSEMVVLLKGNSEQKKMLYDYFFQRIAQGEALEETEIPLFEAARKAISIKSEVVTMSGSATGSSGASV
jgi:hypothetical protein